jgi:hypothetical protein
MQTILVGRPEGERPFGGRLGRCVLDSPVSGQGPMGCCEHGNEPSGSIKGGKFLLTS